MRNTKKEWVLKKPWEQLTDEEKEYIQQRIWQNELQGYEVIVRYGREIVEVI